jgi:protein-disulfide isomerase/uncharacterized membrane protein
MAEIAVGGGTTGRQVGFGFLMGLGLAAMVGFVVSAKLTGGYNPSKPVSLLENAWFCGPQGVTGYGCSGVFASRYGKLWGLPLPMFGMAYFGAILAWLVVFGRKSLNIFFALFLLGGAGMSAWLLFILLFVLPGQCRWCLMIHLCNGLIILGVFTGFGLYGGLLDFSQIREKFLKAVLVALLILALAGWLAAYVLNFQKDAFQNAYIRLKLDENIQLWQFQTQKAKNIPLRPDDHLLGKPTAPVRIIAYKDYQCTHCREAWLLLEKVYRKFPDRVAVVVRHWPLSNQCNPHMNVDQHPFACPAARAVEAVALLKGQKAFWDYNTKLVDYSLRLDEVPYVKLAGEMGIPARDFLAAVEDPRVNQNLQRDILSLKDLGFESVPSIFINGRYVEGWQIPGFLEKLVQRELLPPATQKAK